MRIPKRVMRGVTRNQGQQSVWQLSGTFAYWAWTLTAAGWILTSAVIAGLTPNLKTRVTVSHSVPQFGMAGRLMGDVERSGELLPVVDRCGVSVLCSRWGAC